MNKISKTYISSLIPKGAAILDIGSFNGKDAQELATECETEVHCFEPYPASFEALKLLRDERLILWPYAIGAYHGKSPMCIAKGHNQSNTIKQPKLHKKIWPEIKYRGIINVDITTLDRWNSKMRNGAAVDFIWVDINGAEAEFILGAADTLARTKYLYIEYCVKQLFDKAMSREQTIKALPGFEVVWDYEVGSNYGNLFMKNKNEKLWQIGK